MRQKKVRTVVENPRAELASLARAIVEGGSSSFDDLEESLYVAVCADPSLYRRCADTILRSWCRDAVMHIVALRRDVELRAIKGETERPSPPQNGDITRTQQSLIAVGSGSIAPQRGNFLMIPVVENIPFKDCPKERLEEQGKFLLKHGGTTIVRGAFLRRAAERLQPQQTPAMLGMTEDDAQKLYVDTYTAITDVLRRERMLSTDQGVFRG